MNVLRKPFERTTLTTWSRFSQSRLFNRLPTGPPQEALASLFLIGVLFGAPLLGSDWKRFRGPNGDGRVLTGESERATALQTAWKRDIGSGYSGIAVEGDVLVTCAADGESDVVLALSTNDGSTLWSARLGDAMIGHGGSLDGAIASPTIHNGTVYAFGPRGEFVALDLKTGKEHWRRNLATDDAIVPYYGFASSPLVVGDLVLVQIGGEAGALIAMERKSGEVAWRSFAGEVEAQSPKLMKLHGEEQVVFASNEWVAGVDPAEGTLLWRWAYPGRNSFVVTTSPLALGDNKIFFTPGTDRGVVLEVQPINRMSAGPQIPEPKELWDANLLTRTYSPATVVSDALVGFTSRFLGAYSSQDGEVLWRSRKPGDGFLISIDDQLLIITKAGSLHLVDFDPAEYREVASQQLFDAIVWTPPSYANGAAFVRSMTEIARVDLIRDTPDRVTSSSGTEREERTRITTSGGVPTALEGLLDGPSSELAQRVDRFLEGQHNPILTGDRALFLWQGEAQDVGIAGDFLGMRREGAFRRLADSNLWWYETEVAPRVQYTYILYVDYEAQLDPRNPRVQKSSVMGWDANWVRGPTVEMSYFAMPDWPGPPEHLAADTTATSSPGRMTSVTVDYGAALDDFPPQMQERLSQPLDVWLPHGYDEGDQRYPTVYVHGWRGVRDADAGRWVETLDATAGRLYQAPIVVFAPPLPRQVPFAPVVESVDKAFRTEMNRSARANIGWAFNVHPAFGRTGMNPELFGKLAVQSPHGFSDDIEALPNMLPEPTDEQPFVVYLEWGSLDTRSPSEGWDTRSMSRGVFESLRAAGFTVHGGEVEATSDWKSWRNRTHVMLEALFPLED